MLKGAWVSYTQIEPWYSEYEGHNRTMLLLVITELHVGAYVCHKPYKNAFWDSAHAYIGQIV